MKTDYDVIIIGGGPGGSTAGAFLAKAGKHVLIIEREKFPRFHIGESLLPFGNDVLKASGVWPKLEVAGFMPKMGAEFFTGNGSKSNRFWFKDGLVPGYGRTFQVERSRFDEVLLRHAAETGCEVREECAAKAVAVDADGATVTLATGSVRARWLVDASGRDSFVGRALQWPKIDLKIPKRIAVFAHFTGVFRYEGDLAGHITIVRLKDGWFWFIPLDAAKTSVGMVRKLEDFDKAHETMEDWYRRTVAGSSELSRRMSRAQLVGKFYTTSDYTFRHREFAAERVMLVGDAGGFIDPIFSSGVSIATNSGKLAAEAIVRAGERRLMRREQRRYTTTVQRMMDVYLRMIQMYYDNAAFEVFMHPRSRFGVVQAVNSVLAGNTRRNFGLWWRQRLFYFFCRMQKRQWPIAPHLDFSEQTTRS